MNNEICQDFLNINMNVPKIYGSERLKAHEHKLQYIFKEVSRNSQNENNIRIFIRWSCHKSRMK